MKPTPTRGSTRLGVLVVGIAVIAASGALAGAAYRADSQKQQKADLGQRRRSNTAKKAPPKKSLACRNQDKPSSPEETKSPPKLKAQDLPNGEMLLLLRLPPKVLAVLPVHEHQSIYNPTKDLQKECPPRLLSPSCKNH
ncbi:hypothetical protein Dda_2910 [Drechslerella dactyloides]|uniref:Uncharacterized protein n=1 Tax=Drechslerella dactyloides TaxID=74499 RepID=A0AAD6NLA1_DREDA|nr:hypothetical protein Dda_2910 [Drechslerella dactyloides]